MTLRIGVSVLPGEPGALDIVREAERLGADSIWVPEFWAYDAMTPLAHYAAWTERVRLVTGIVQLGARTPAMLAMSAMSLQSMSGGRFVLGVGTSGPQVMEGWHGVSFERPVRRTRETIEIVRAIARGDRLSYDGELYRLPLPDGAGRAIRSMAPPVDVPIHVASLGPANLRMTGELADGWIGNSFFPESASVYLDELRAGASAAGRSLDELEITVAVGLEITDDVEEAGRRHADGYAFTFGAMGSASQNFYNDAFGRLGFGDAVAEVQRLWLAGDRAAAAAAVPVEIGLGTNLIGTPEMIAARLRAHQAAGVTALRVGLTGDSVDRRLEQLATLVELASSIGDDAT